MEYEHHGFAESGAMSNAMQKHVIKARNTGLNFKERHYNMIKKYFFLDDEHVALHENVARVFHEPVKHGKPILAPETPLEGQRLALWNAPLLSEDGGHWRLWYIGGDDSLPLYADSEDGLNWRRPDLGLVEHNAKRNNNLVDLGFPAKSKYQRFVMAPNPSGDRGEKRYCALIQVDGTTLKPLFSSDGFKWRLLADNPGLFSNDEYRLVGDPEKGLLIATVKLYGYVADMSRQRFSVPEYGRAVGLFTSRDGLTWTDMGLIYHADSADRAAGVATLARHAADPDYLSPIYNAPEYSWTDIYNMPVFPYHGIYLGLPAMFQHSGYFASPNQDGLLWPALTWSNDLMRWNRPLERKPFIPLSPCTDKYIYDNGMIFACPPVRRDNELWFYYTGCRHSHVTASLLEKSGLDYAREKTRAAVFLARLRLDGFASMRAGEQKGAILTHPVVVEGPNLRVNGRTRHGEILAEIRDAATGRVIPGFGLGDYLAPKNITFPDGVKQPRLAGLGARHIDDTTKNDAVPFGGDEVDACMAWRGGNDLSALKGRTVRIFFAMRNADIYSFWFGA